MPRKKKKNTFSPKPWDPVIVDSSLPRKQVWKKLRIRFLATLGIAALVMIASFLIMTQRDAERTTGGALFICLFTFLFPRKIPVTVSIGPTRVEIVSLTWRMRPVTRSFNRVAAIPSTKIYNPLHREADPHRKRLTVGNYFFPSLFLDEGKWGWHRPQLNTIFNAIRRKYFPEEDNFIQ